MTKLVFFHTWQQLKICFTLQTVIPIFISLTNVNLCSSLDSCFQPTTPLTTLHFYLFISILYFLPYQLICAPLLNLVLVFLFCHVSTTKHLRYLWDTHGLRLFYNYWFSYTIFCTYFTTFFSRLSFKGLLLQLSLIVDQNLSPIYFHKLIFISILETSLRIWYLIWESHC